MMKEHENNLQTIGGMDGEEIVRILLRILKSPYN